MSEAADRDEAPAAPRRRPKFSVIVVHYQGVNSHEVFCRGIDSLMAQSFKDMEILAYHDGPLLDPRIKMPVPITCTERRYGDWGHSLRDRGIREASGEYIVHFNADNILYPNALEEIAREIARPPRIFDERGRALDTDDIIIFPILMRGLQKFRNLMVMYKDDPSFYLILTGNPPAVHNIDCMQLVMKRELWLREGGWYDKRDSSDGHMYQAFAQKYGYRTVGPVLGEHY
jgi:glycosyl transferase family 2